MDRFSSANRLFAHRLDSRRALAARLVFATSVIAALGCSTTPTAPPSVHYVPYRAGAPDALTVTILPDPIVIENAIVRPDGMITVQLVGDVLAGGRTVDEIAADIEGQISKFKRGARVTVALTAAQSQAITVLGEVRQPGTFSLVKNIRVAEALGNQGGTTIFANLDDIRVVRSLGGVPLVLQVDMGAIRSGDLTTNIQLYQGDIIFVPPTIWARIGYTMQALFFPLSPFMGVINSAMGAAIAF
jgi:polysaccharide export outer membrane protein